MFIDISKDLQLISLDDRDAGVLYQVIQDTRKQLRTWIPWVDQLKTESDVLAYLRQVEDRRNAMDGTWLKICYEGAFAGSIGIDHWSKETKRAELGYWLDPRFRGKGILTRSLKAFLAYLFEQMSIEKLEIHCLPENIASIKTAETSGFVLEGRIRNSTLHQGILKDTLIFGLLRQEWKLKN